MSKVTLIYALNQDGTVGGLIDSRGLDYRVADLFMSGSPMVHAEKEDSDEGWYKLVGEVAKIDKDGNKILKFVYKDCGNIEYKRGASLGGFVVGNSMSAVGVMSNNPILMLAGGITALSSIGYRFYSHIAHKGYNI